MACHHRRRSVLLVRTLSFHHLVFRGKGVNVKKPDWKGATFYLAAWILALIIYGMAGESDRQSAADLTADVDRAAVMEGRQ